MGKLAKEVKNKVKIPPNPYFTGAIGIWYCKSCGMKWYSFDKKCIFCKEKEENRENKVARWQYVPVDTMPCSKRGYYEGDIYF